MKKYIILLLCVVMLFLPRAAKSEPELQGLEATFSAGGLIGDTFLETTILGLRVKGEVDDGFIGTGRVAYFPFDNLGGEINIGVATNDGIISVAGVSVETDSSTLHFDAGPIVQYKLNSFVPFLSLGLGLAVIDVDDTIPGVTVEDRTTEFTINVGGGFKYFITDNVGVRFDVRDHIVFLTDDDFWGPGAENSISLIEISGGIFYHF